MKVIFIQNGKIVDDEGQSWEICVIPSDDAHGPHVQLTDQDGDKVLLLFTAAELDAIAEISPLWLNRWKSLDSLTEGGG